MARKRKIISSLRGSSKRAKKSMGGSRKKFRTGRTRLRPEVKFLNSAGADIDIRNFKGSAVDLDVSEVKLMTSFPAQGTTDSSRIGDTIMGRKVYIRMFVYQPDARADNACMFRIIIFNLKFDLPTTNIANFWQVAIGPNSMTGLVNREVVNKVFYDKVVEIQPQINAKASYKKPRNINISMRWPVIFSGGSTTPKDPRNRIYMHVCGYSATPVAGAILGAYCYSSNFYYTDA